VKNDLVVQVVCSSRYFDGPVQARLTGFYGTAIMNVISWKSAYCLFPHTTFVERGMRILEWTGSPKEQMAIAKYEQRGWPVLNWYPEAEDVEPDEYEKERRVGDHLSWVIALDASESADSSVESVRFAVGPVLVLLESRRRRRVEKLQDSTL
jgi:hypothetical protein